MRAREVFYRFGSRSDETHSLLDARRGSVGETASIRPETERPRNFDFRAGDYATRIFAEAEKSRVALQGYFVATAVAIRVMEGVANALDPDVQIGKLALPWIASSKYAGEALRG